MQTEGSHTNFLLTLIDEKVSVADNLAKNLWKTLDNFLIIYCLLIFSNTVVIYRENLFSVKFCKANSNFLPSN